MWHRNCTQYRRTDESSVSQVLASDETRKAWNNDGTI